MVQPYEFRIDNSDATVITTFILAVSFWIAAFCIGQTCNILGFSPRFARTKSPAKGFPPTSDDGSLYDRIERVTGSYEFAFGFFGLAFLFSGILRQEFPNAENPETGYLVFARLRSFCLYIGCSSIILAASNTSIVGELPSYNVLLWFTRVFAGVYDIWAIVVLVLTPTDEYTYVGAIIVIIAFIPAFTTTVVSLKAHMSQDSHVDKDDRLGTKTTGRYLLAVALLLTIFFFAVFILGFDSSCSKFEPYPTCDCVFDTDFTHNFFFNICLMLNLFVYVAALLRRGNEPPSYLPDVVVPSENPNVVFEDPTQPAEELKLSEEPVAKETVRSRTPSETHTPTPTTTTATTTSTSTSTATATATPVKQPEKEPKSSSPTIANPTFDKNSTAPPQGLIEDSVLRKMYDLFTETDDGTIDDADAGLTEEEFVATVTIEKLEEILKPIGGLDLTRVDPTVTHAKGVKIPISLIFSVLDKDKNDRVTASEFIKLLRKNASKTYTVIVRDSILKKLYDLFSKADNGTLDIEDAGLTAHELEGTVTVAELEDILAPIGGLDLTRVDASFVATEPMNMSTVFSVLDKNGNDRLSAIEFLKLLKDKSGTLVTDAK